MFKPAYSFVVSIALICGSALGAYAQTIIEPAQEVVVPVKPSSESSSELSVTEMAEGDHSAAQVTAGQSTLIFERAKAATVIVLAGEGAGRLKSVATGVVVSKDGVILTALHPVKGAAEVQIRMANGDIFDHVELLGFDERRDVAALKISAGALRVLTPGSTASLVQGEPIFAVANASGLGWSATEGILSAIRPADEVAGAGSGFRLLQFTAPTAPGSSGGALVDRTGALIGIITGKKGTATFAVPVENLLGLFETGHAVPFGSGAFLQMPAQQAAAVPRSSASLANSDPRLMLRNARTLYVSSDTMFLTVETMQRALMNEKDWNRLGLSLVEDERLADLVLHVDRLVFTHVHTYVLSDKRTSIVLAAGRKTSFDGVTAAPDIADRIVKSMADARSPDGSKTQWSEASASCPMADHPAVKARRGDWVQSE